MKRRFCKNLVYSTIKALLTIYKDKAIEHYNEGNHRACLKDCYRWLGVYEVLNQLDMIIDEDSDYKLIYKIITDIFMRDGGDL